MWKGKRSSLGHIKIWGCEVFVRREAQDKLEARSEKCLFLGYLKESFGYLFYKPKDNVVFVARRGVFLEREMISKEDSESKIDLEDIQDSANEEPIYVRVSKPSQDPQFYYGFHIEEDKISDSTLTELNEPANYKEAMASPEAAKWKEAMKSEIQSMYDNQVWNLVDTTPGLKTVGCKWIFKKKTDMDGKVHTYKARLVAKGYTQTHEIDYEETFSPVAKIKSIRIMLAIAAFHDYEIWQMDVKTAFLNGKLTEDVFMAQPEGFENEKYPKRVCKLQKAIYGLKQASRSWNLCFHEKVTQFGFSRSKDESCVYVKVSGSVVVFLVLYVDDILLIGNDIPTLQSVKDWLGKCFAMKDLGDASYILDDELDKMSRVPYASAIGLIIYVITCTRPDVSFALSMVSPHQQNPGEIHWTVVKNILRYLRNTKDRFLVYGGEKELKSSAVALDGTLYLVDQDRVRPIIVDDLSKWETIGFSPPPSPNSIQIQELTNQVFLLQSQKFKLEKGQAEAAFLKAQPSFPNVQYLTELMVNALKTELAKLLTVPSYLKTLPDKLEEFETSILTLTTKVASLGDFRLEIPAGLLALLGKVSSIHAHLIKLKVLDALPSLLDKVDAAMHMFAKAIDSTSQKAGDNSVPSAGQANTHPTEGEKNTRQPTSTQLFQRRQEKNAANINRNKQPTKPIT
ncbi:putative RNA-directed DNA polymerase [Tanacetum coccineum]